MKELNAVLREAFKYPRPFSSMSVMENLLVPFAFVGGKDGPVQQKEAMAHTCKVWVWPNKAFVQSNQLSQVELRKMELARAMAAKPKLADLRRSHGGSSWNGSRRSS